MVEKMGKTFGEKLGSSLITQAKGPGPGQYDQEKLKRENLKYSMGSKLQDFSNKFKVPGPGTYEPKNNFEAIKSMKFGTGNRSSMEM